MGLEDDRVGGIGADPEIRNMILEMMAEEQGQAFDRPRPRGGIANYRNARHSGRKFGDSVLRFWALCCSCLLGIAILVMSIYAIVLGAQHQDDCPAEPNIPAMLIALNVISCVGGVFEVCGRMGSKALASTSGSQGKSPGCCICINSILGLTYSALFVYTCVIVYRIYETVVFTPEEATAVAWAGAHHYCHQLVYLFTFWFVSILLGLVAISIVVSCAVKFCYRK
jgi:hypothetical protein